MPCLDTLCTPTQDWIGGLSVSLDTPVMNSRILFRCDLAGPFHPLFAVHHVLQVGQRHYYFMNVGNGEVIDACRKVSSVWL